MLGGLAVLTLLGTAAACSSDNSASAPAATGRPAAARTASQSGKKKPAVDACTLLQKDEIEGIIGRNSGGHVGAGVGESVCEWDNETNYHSVTVSLGNQGTAPGGKITVDKVPGAGPAEAGPDGISFASDNTGTFAIADRECYIQVVTDPTSNKDRTTTVRLVRLVRARTAGKF